MNIPIRMLGIATIIFWVILIGYFVSAAYSIKDVNLNLGEPQFATTPTNDLRFSIPIYLDNRGYYSLKAFNLTANFLDFEEAGMVSFTTYIPVIPPGQKMTVLHNFTLNADILAEQEKYLFNDTNLNCKIIAGLNFAEILPGQLEMNITIPWGAPFYGFDIGQPTIINSVLPQIEIIVPLSFENHAAFDISGAIRIELCNSAGLVLTENQTPINVAKQMPCDLTMNFKVPSDSVSPTAALTGNFKVYFSTSTFEYGPLVIPVG